MKRMTAHDLSLNGHLELETEKNPQRSYFATLRGSRPQFSSDNLLAEVQAETEHWMTQLTSTEAASFLQALGGTQHVFDGLQHEARALKDITKALAAHGKGEWGEASRYYGNALSDLHFAMHGTANDTPFDPYYPTKEERARHNIEEPPRASYEEMREVSPDLFRIFRNLDRVFCIGQEIVQRQMTCLSNYMQEAKAQYEASREERPESQNAKTDG
jgi:hypothetical protein